MPQVIHEVTFLQGAGNTFLNNFEMVLLYYSQSDRDTEDVYS